MFYVWRRVEDDYVSSTCYDPNKLWSRSDKFEILLETENWAVAHDLIVETRQKLTRDD